MKILVITRNAWDDTNAIGNTVSNFFEHFDNCEFANIYFRASSPNNKICKRYYRTTEFEVLRNWFSPEKNGKEDYLSPWRFTSDDGRFEMRFEPVMDRCSKTDLGIICSDQHQVFGRFSGTAVLDDGRTIVIDHMTGFAEKVRNKW